MEIRICDDAKHLGRSAARQTAEILRRRIHEIGSARIMLSTGASQFDTLKALVNEDVDWSKVEMFHLDEYVGLPETHKASFRKYLKERVLAYINVKKFHFVDNNADCIPVLTAELRRAPIDVGLIGIGENAHIAFNDPPADFNTQEAYIAVSLDDACKAQQVGEGWFATKDEVPNQAISMTVYQILQCESIISCVPYKVKAKSVYDILQSEKTPLVPATILKEHKDFTLYLDRDSASLILREELESV